MTKRGGKKLEKEIETDMKKWLKPGKKQDVNKLMEVKYTKKELYP